MDVFQLLTQTYPRYVDSASRDAVEQVGMMMIEKDETADQKMGVTEQVLGWLAHEVSLIAKHGSPGSVSYYSHLQMATDDHGVLAHMPLQIYSFY
jgi:hypothetical protein